MLKIRRYFLSGLLITLPVFLSIYILFIGFRFIDGILGKFINAYLKHHVGFAVPGLGLILGVFSILFIGFITTNFLGKKIFHILEHWFLKFPMIRLIYLPTKQIIHSLISNEQQAFKKVVLVEYPSEGMWSVGFVTNETFREAREKTGEDLLHVLIGSTPSPFSGYLVLIPKRKVKFLEMSIEDAIKLIVSGGIVKP